MSKEIKPLEESSSQSGGNDKIRGIKDRSTKTQNLKNDEKSYWESTFY